jgi:hypothetical protein
MTEQEWLASDDPTQMLAAVTPSESSRGHRAPLSASGVRPASDRQLRMWCAALYDLSAHDYSLDFDLDAWRRGDPSETGHVEARGPAALAGDWADPAMDEAGDPPMPLRAALLRDVVGNPWRPVALPPGPAFVVCGACGRMSVEKAEGRCPRCGAKARLWGNEGCPWLTPAVTAVAAEIRDGGRFEDMPILADALSDAGCDSADILDHLRGPGPHCRGCWALSLLLDGEMSV